MEYKKGADVISKDGEKIGTLERVVINPKTKEVAYLVVKSGFLLTEDKLIPMDQVGTVTENQIHVMATKEKLDELPRFEEEHYVPLDKEGEGIDLYYWYPPVGWGASGYYPPFPQPLYKRKTEQNIPENMVALKEGAKVIASDGEHIGNIERILTDAKNEAVTHLVVSSGLLQKERKLVPTYWLTDVSEDEVHLSVDSHDFDRLPDFVLKIDEV